MYNSRILHYSSKLKCFHSDMQEGEMKRMRVRSRYKKENEKENNELKFTTCLKVCIKFHFF